MGGRSRKAGNNICFSSDCGGEHACMYGGWGNSEAEIIMIVFGVVLICCVWMCVCVEKGW